MPQLERPLRATSERVRAFAASVFGFAVLSAIVE